MITYKTGNIFNSSAQVITNTVNCVGVMGAGLAKAFKSAYPDMYADYVKRCDKGEVKIGQPYIWEDDTVQILNFPTKRHWKNPSSLEDVEKGLKYLAERYGEMGITSLSLPPLGCGLGGLEWSDVKNLINKYLGSLEDLDVYVYEKYESKEDTDSDQKSKVVTKSSGQDIAAQPSLF